MYRGGPGGEACEDERELRDKKDLSRADHFIKNICFERSFYLLFFYEKMIFCHRPLLYRQTKKIPRTSQSIVIATQTPKIPI